MSFMIGKIALQPRIDQVYILLDNSVSQYLSKSHEDKLRLIDDKIILLEIIDNNIQGYNWRKYGNINELKKIIDGILMEICLEEVQLAIHWFQVRGIKKCINYLMDCVS